MRPFPPSPKRAGLVALSIALAATALAGCVGDAEATSALYVKDALTDDVEAVHVTFTKAQVKPETGPWTTVYEGKETIELLSLSAADARAELASFGLTPGDYEGLRIFVSEVEVTLLDGNTTHLNVYGNIVSIAEAFTVTPDGIHILVDFDLEEGVDLDAGTYTPFVKDVQTDHRDSDGDGRPDFVDTDDDNDGVPDNEDDDNDGDGRDDRPRQRHGDLETICAADFDGETLEATGERDVELAEAEEELQEELDDSDRRSERVEAWAEYNETVHEIHVEYDEEVSEAHAERAECLRGHDDDDDDDADDHDEDDGRRHGDDDRDRGRDDESDDHRDEDRQD